MGGISHIIGLVKFPAYNPDRMLEISELGELKINGKKNPGSEQEHDKPGMSANKGIEVYEKVMNFVHGGQK
jgi:hypothetical protein